jgi:hypothetical protein
LRHDSCSVAGDAVSAAGAAVFHAVEGGEALSEDFVGAELACGLMRVVCGVGRSIYVELHS